MEFWQFASGIIVIALGAVGMFVMRRRGHKREAAD